MNVRAEGRERNFVDEDKTFTLPAKEVWLPSEIPAYRKGVKCSEQSLTFWKLLFTIDKQTDQRAEKKNQKN